MLLIKQLLSGDSEKKDYKKWFKNNVISNESSLSSNYDLDNTPYFSEIIENYLKSPLIKNINVLAPTGAGKTAMFIALINYIMVNQPGPMLVALQNDAEAKSVCESRLFPTLRNNPKLKDILPDKRSGQRKCEIISENMNLWVVAANPGSLQSKSCRYLIGDEVWQWKRGMIKEFLARHHNRYNRKILLTSQGGWLGTDWGETFKEGKKFTLNFLCKKCSTYHPLIFNNFHFLKDDNLSDRERSESIKLVCPSCEYALEDTPLNRKDIMKSAKYIEDDINEKCVDTISFQFNAFAIHHIPWSETLLEFLKANEKKKRGLSEDMYKFQQKRLALNIGVTEDDLIKLDVKYDSSLSIKRGYDISGDNFLTVDVQKNHFWYTIWTIKNNEMYLRECGRVAESHEIKTIQEKWNISGRVFLDAAYDTSNTHKICIDNKWIAVNATQSEHYKHKRGKWRKSGNIFSELESTLLGNKEVWKINYSSQKSKDLFILLLNEGKVHIPSDVSKEFISQLTNEYQTIERDKVTGRPKTVWKSKANNSHMLDTSVCAMVMGMYEGLININE